MIPWRELDRAIVPGQSAPLVLSRHDTEFAIRIGTHILMSSRSHGTEEILAEMACARIPDRTAARILIGGPGKDPSWLWPAPRLTYANAVLPEALLVIGSALDDQVAVRDGLTMLTWLIEQETRGDHLSVTPAGGWQRGEPRPGFDQQPIEVTALAEACWRAFGLTGDGQWLTALERCVAWFLGANDCGLDLYDPVSGGGRDGLHVERVNENQGAESTLAVLATFQLGRHAAAELVG